MGKQCVSGFLSPPVLWLTVCRLGLRTPPSARWENLSACLCSAEARGIVKPPAHRSDLGPGAMGVVACCALEVQRDHSGVVGGDGSRCWEAPFLIQQVVAILASIEAVVGVAPVLAGMGSGAAEGPTVSGSGGC